MGGGGCLCGLPVWSASPVLSSSLPSAWKRPGNDWPRFQVNTLGLSLITEPVVAGLGCMLMCWHQADCVNCPLG